MTIGGLFTETQLLGGPAVVPLSLYREVVPEAQRSDLIDYVNLAPGADRSAVQSALIALAKPYAVLSVQSGSEWTQSEADQVNTMLNILYALLALSVLIAVLGIVNTLAMSVLERTREIGLLRAVGLSRGQLTSMITVESVATALFGALMGTGLGLGLGVGLQHGLRAEGLQSLAVPWGSISLMILAAAFAGVVAAVAPAVKAARMDVLAAIAID
jgi:putative ABC transport system permease protein